jgi:hypothetical protein
VIPCQPQTPGPRIDGRGRAGRLFQDLTFDGVSQRSQEPAGVDLSFDEVVLRPFPDAYGLLFVASAFRGLAKDVLRAAALDTFGITETIKIAPDIFIGGVAFDSFGAGVPPHNYTLSVQHEDGVVLNSVVKHLISVVDASKGVRRCVRSWSGHLRTPLNSREDRRARSGRRSRCGPAAEETSARSRRSRTTAVGIGIARSASRPPVTPG